MVEPHTKACLGIYEWAGVDTACTYVTVLERVLRLLAVPGSVGHDLCPDQELAPFLQTRTHRDPRAPISWALG
jgi:hypothetical protein